VAALGGGRVATSHAVVEAKMAANAIACAFRRSSSFDGRY
jgi:hypothetical protein